MKIIGLCGGSGSGKGAVSKILNEFNIPTIDTDALYHEMTSYISPCLSALACEFGSEIISSDGALDRRKLADIVFSAEDSDVKRCKLNSVSHRYIKIETEELITKYKNAGFEFAVIDAPLLFESGFDKMCDITVAVIADEDVRIQRIINRDGIDFIKALQRIKAQLNNSELASLCDYTIVNNGTLEELYDNTLGFIRKIQI